MVQSECNRKELFDRTFGVIHQDMLLRDKKEGMNIGVTAEIFSSKEEGDDFRYCFRCLSLLGPEL